MLTTDPNDPAITHGTDTEAVPQDKVYLVLSDDERAKGFVRPYRDAYRHTGMAPQGTLRELTPEEHERYDQFKYAAFEPAPESAFPVTGRYWTQQQLDDRGCGKVTTMGRAIAETYARDPKFYGATYCTHCQKHRPVGEFSWVEMNGTAGPVVGS